MEFEKNDKMKALTWHPKKIWIVLPDDDLITGETWLAYHLINLLVFILQKLVPVL